jgi:hypothetical protein
MTVFESESSPWYPLTEAFVNNEVNEVLSEKASYTLPHFSLKGIAIQGENTQLNPVA